MDLFPAIDLRNGKCVRLHQGDYGQETIYGDDPVAQALAFADAGAGWIHVVDLDAARTGVPENRDVVAAIAAAVPVPVQTGGGVRNRAAALALFDAGVERVVIGTAALADPDFVLSLIHISEPTRRTPISYAAEPGPDVVATCAYGGDLVAAVGRDHVWACQFHPEKSGRNGLRILENFVAAAREA